jgi:hypothetical protein
MFEVRWRSADRDRSRSFMSRALADSYRAELIRAARKGLAFTLTTGEPESWATPEPEPVTWYQHAVAYAEMKWPHLAPHSRASLADALATVTPLLARGTGSRPPTQILRAALYGHAFNARWRSDTPTPDTASALAWAERASLPLSQLSDPRVIRAALDRLCTRLDGSPGLGDGLHITCTRSASRFHAATRYSNCSARRVSCPAREKASGNGRLPPLARQGISKPGILSRCSASTLSGTIWI